jgi:hypothetical protein
MGRPVLGLVGLMRLDREAVTGLPPRGGAVARAVRQRRLRELFGAGSYCPAVAVR